MVRFDSGQHWDSGLTYDQPESQPNPNPKKGNKMKRQDYFPTRIGDQIVWLTNYKTSVALRAAALSLDPADVTATQLDADNARYGLDDYRGALATASTSGYQTIQAALYDDSAPAAAIAWPGFTPPAPIPAAVNKGCLKRIFAYISDVIKKSPGYTTAIGEDLGIEGPAAATPSPTISPEFSLRSSTDDKMEILWTKGEFDGIKIEIDRGPAGLLTDMDLRPNYTLNWLPPAGQSAVIKVRLRYLYKGADYGTWSPWQNWTLTGA